MAGSEQFMWMQKQLHAVIKLYAVTASIDTAPVARAKPLQGSLNRLAER